MNTGSRHREQPVARLGDDVEAAMNVVLCLSVALLHDLR
jgi:hypothetical protein